MSPSLLTEKQFNELSNDGLQTLYERLCAQLNSVCFPKMYPGYKMESRGMLGSLVGAFGGPQPKRSKTDEYVENILRSTVNAHLRTGFHPKLNGQVLRRTLNYKRFQDINLILENFKHILHKEKMELLGFDEPLVSDNSETWDQMEDNDDDDIDENIKAQTIVADEAKILATLESGAWADLAIIGDKYTIRIGDGKYWVASDEVKIVMRDPSERPSWAIWFMSAVPLEKIPDRAAMMFMDEKEFSKYSPPDMGEHFLVCHASLWKMKNKSLVILHTSWNHISATYRWLIDKPIDVASVLFKAVSHPAHLARNFGYSPNLVIPGDDWLL